MAKEEVIELLRDMLKKCQKQFPSGIVCLSASEISQKLSGTANKKNIERAVSHLKSEGEIESIKIDVKLARKIYGKNMKNGLQLFFFVKE